MLQKFRKNTDALVRRGLAFSELGQLEYAIGDFSRAMRIDGKKASAFYRRRLALEGGDVSDGDLEVHKRRLELELSRRQAKEAFARAAVAFAALSQAEEKRARKAPVQSQEAPPEAQSAPPPGEDLFFLIVPAFLTLASLAVLIYLAIDRDSERKRREDRLPLS